MGKKINFTGISKFSLALQSEALVNTSGRGLFSSPVSVVEETGLNLNLWETPKTGFVVTRPIYEDVIIPVISFRCEGSGVVTNDWCITSYHLY